MLAVLLLAGWLLRGWRMAARLVVAAVLSAVGVVLVVRLGFVEGLLSGVLGSSQVETLDAFAAPMAWAVGFALVAGWMVLGWGAAARRSMSARAPPVRRCGRSPPPGAPTSGPAVLLWLPFLALAVNSWRIPADRSPPQSSVPGSWRPRSAASS